MPSLTEKDAAMERVFNLRQELDRTKKQLEIAVNALKKLEEKAYLTEYAQGVVDKALKEITALEQKDVKWYKK